MAWSGRRALDQGPATSLRRIVEPGTPAWVRDFSATESYYRLSGRMMAAVFGYVALAVSGAVAVAHGAVVPGLFLFIAPLVLLFGLVMVASQRAHAIGPPGWEYEGVPIRGQAFAMLEDIDGRFFYAQRLVGEIPTGIVWRDVADDVDALRWEAGTEAAKVSALDAEIAEMGYAERGTPQHAFRLELERRREEHWHLLEDIQREADSLARQAGNAAAAAKVAQARFGNVRALDVAVPTGRGLVARDALEAARARLALLAEVWAELSEGGLPAAEAKLEQLTEGDERS